MEFIRDIFNKRVKIAVLIHKSEYTDFVKIMNDHVKKYQVDKCQVGDDVIWAISLRKNRYKLMLEALPKHNLNVVVYATTLLLHEIKK